MEDTAKAIAIENKWLFTEIDVQDILIKFLYTDEQGNSQDKTFTQLFQYAKKESMDQKVTYMIVIKGIDQLLNDRMAPQLLHQTLGGVSE